MRQEQASNCLSNSAKEKLVTGRNLRHNQAQGGATTYHLPII